jgi:hypothetical protein
MFMVYPSDVYQFWFGFIPRRTLTSRELRSSKRLDGLHHTAL